MMTESGEKLKLVGGWGLIKSESNKFENYGLEILPVAAIGKIPFTQRRGCWLMLTTEAVI